MSPRRLQQPRGRCHLYLMRPGLWVCAGSIFWGKGATWRAAYSAFLGKGAKV